jgi:hypothetical protein
MHTNAVSLATAGYDVLKECEAARAAGLQKLKKGDNLYTKAVVQASAGHNGLQECEAPRALLKLTQGDNLYTNAVFLATAGHDVLRECEVSRLASGSGSLEKAESLFANAVVQATRGHDVFRDTGLYLVHADELVSLQRDGIGRDEDDLRVLEEDIGRVPWILARGKQPSCSADIFSHFDLELLSADDIAKLVTGEFSEVEPWLPPLSTWLIL